MTERTMTKGERDELAVVVRMRAKVARAEVDTRRATVVAEAEARLATIFKAQDARWAVALADARRKVDDANARIKAELTEAGVPDELHPGVGMYFYGRGENDTAARRAELRRVVATRADANARVAKDAVNRWEMEARTDLASRALESGEARAWLEQLPSVAQLMPPLDVETLAVLPARTPATAGAV
jgi:hypothetical protein